jgi:6-phosphofructokinase 1
LQSILKLQHNFIGTKRVFIVEVMGNFCGYLATVSGLAAGADASYIFEEKFTIKDLQRDFNNMASKMADVVQRGLILRNEKANENYNTDFIHRLFAEEGNEQFSTRANILGHMQQGGIPSPFDRCVATKMASQAAEWISEQVKNNSRADGTVSVKTDESACILCLQQRNHTFVPIKSLFSETDFKYF